MNRRMTGTTGLAALALSAASLVALPSPAGAASAMAAPPPVVRISMNGDQATISQNQMRPGVVEFRVGKTFTVPGPNGGPDSLNVVATDRLDEVLIQVSAAFDPAAGPQTQAQAMRAIASLATLYGGATSGAAWQVYLPAGTYYVLGPQTTAMGLAKAVQFTVAGLPRAVGLHRTAGTIRAVTVKGANKWATTGLDSLGDGWLKFANSTNEIHYLDMSGVKANTTNAMVRKALMTGADVNFQEPRGMHFDVISPGVSVAIRGPFEPGMDLIACFIPSATTGIPHALTGMWKLVDVG